jgi:hypothetical protein
MEVNRMINDNPALDDVDHALGRPFRPATTYRDHYATCCPEQKAAMRASGWWKEGRSQGDMTWFFVTMAGRKALAQELKDHTKYGRLYTVSRSGVDRYVVAKSRSAARYRAFIDADLGWTFMEFCEGLSVRLAR